MAISFFNDIVELKIKSNQNLVLHYGNYKGDLADHHPWMAHHWLHPERFVGVVEARAYNSN